MQPLYELVHYQADIEYLFNTHIREYDMRRLQHLDDLI